MLGFSGLAEILLPSQEGFYSKEINNKAPDYVIFFRHRETSCHLEADISASLFFSNDLGLCCL